MYRIEANIDTRFPSLAAARRAYLPGELIHPSIPFGTMPDEDKITPRIPVCPTIDDCLTAIGLLGRLKRCLAANEDAMSYETEGREVYPIIILRFPDKPYMHDYIKPSKAQVPDVDISNEYWLTEPTAPDSATVVWLTPRSILWSETGDITVPYKAESMNCYIDGHLPADKIHPWLTGTGHVLSSSKHEDEAEDETEK